MSIFFENDPTLQSYWRSIILYGRNVASYKFALGKALIDLNKKPNDLIKLEDLSEPFSNHLCEHLKVNEKQILNEFVEIIDKENVFVSETAIKAVEGVDAVLVLTEWEEFKNLEWDTIFKFMRKPAWVFDSRNCLDKEALIRIGFKVWSLGNA